MAVDLNVPVVVEGVTKTYDKWWLKHFIGGGDPNSTSHIYAVLVPGRILLDGTWELASQEHYKEVLMQDFFAEGTDTENSIMLSLVEALVARV